MRSQHLHRIDCGGGGMKDTFAFVNTVGQIGRANVEALFLLLGSFASIVVVRSFGRHDWVGIICVERMTKKSCRGRETRAGDFVCQDPTTSRQVTLPGMPPWRLTPMHDSTRQSLWGSRCSRQRVIYSSCDLCWRQCVDGPSRSEAAAGLYHLAIRNLSEHVFVKTHRASSTWPCFCCIYSPHQQPGKTMAGP